MHRINVAPHANTARILRAARLARVQAARGPILPRPMRERVRLFVLALLTR